MPCVRRKDSAAYDCPWANNHFNAIVVRDLPNGHTHKCVVNKALYYGLKSVHDDMPIGRARRSPSLRLLPDRLFWSHLPIQVHRDRILLNAG